MPLKVGNAGKSHFKANFQKGGFVDQNLKKWEPAKRISRAKGAKGQYGTLLSARNHLNNSINYRVLSYQVIIFTRVPYAIVHNEGLRAGRGKGFRLELPSI
ncbi:MAG: phage virion morphogenesis protein [Candidatus Aphodosoma sp.]